MSFISADRLATLPRRLTVLRWWLLGSLTGAVLIVPPGLGVPLPLAPMMAVLALMAAFNVAVRWRSDREEWQESVLARQMLVDLIGMGVLLYLSGGAANPLVSLLLVPVAVAALVLSGTWVFFVAAAAVVLYSFLMLYSVPLSISDAERATRLHLGGMWVTFVVSVAMFAWFVSRMTASIRARDAQIAAVREDALRDAQVVALGQLAAGAAHELGTPLATIGVLAGELAHDARLHEEAHEDIDLLRRQVEICKDILGRLTRSAGIERADAASGMALNLWLERVLARWRSLWPQASCALTVPDMRESFQKIVPDPSLEQAIVNLLNNAARTAPQGMRLVAGVDDAWLCLTVEDAGPGFPEDVLRSGGAEPLLAGATGAGIGLWLTRAAVERLEGALLLENMSHGGAATIRIPLRRLVPLQMKEDG